MVVAEIGSTARINERGGGGRDEELERMQNGNKRFRLKVARKKLACDKQTE